MAGPQSSQEGGVSSTWCPSPDSSPARRPHGGTECDQGLPSKAPAAPHHLRTPVTKRKSKNHEAADPDPLQVPEARHHLRTPVTKRKSKNQEAVDPGPSPDVLGTPTKTPSRTPARSRCTTPLRPVQPGSGAHETPKVKHSALLTPPSGPCLMQKRLDDDIELALRWNSTPLLCQSLMRGHCCRENHLVYEAVHRQNIDALEFILRRNPPDLESSCRGRRPLDLAVQVCMSDGDIGYRMAGLLLQYGARPEPSDMEATEPPLLEAAKRGCIAAMALLLSYGADPNVADASGFTPLHIVVRQMPFYYPISAQMSKIHQVICLLMGSGACPVQADRFGLLPRHYVRDTGTQGQLVRAENCWNRGTLAVAQGRCRADPDSGELCCSSGFALLPPSLLEALVQYL